MCHMPYIIILLLRSIQYIYNIQLSVAVLNTSDRVEVEVEAGGLFVYNTSGHDM